MEGKNKKTSNSPMNTEKFKKLTVSEDRQSATTAKETEQNREKHNVTELFKEVGKIGWHHTKELVETMNNARNKPENSWIQFQTYRTYFYGVMASAVSYTNPKNGTIWVCVKVGYTQLEDAMARPLQVHQETIKHLARFAIDDIEPEAIADQVRVIFSVFQSPIDPRLPVEIEASVREAVGLPISKKDAKSFSLPVPTEWVTTNIPHLLSVLKICQKPNADSSSLTKLSAYGGKLPEEFKLQRTKNIIPTSDIPDILAPEPSDQ